MFRSAQLVRCLPRRCHPAAAATAGEPTVETRETGRVLVSAVVVLLVVLFLAAAVIRLFEIHDDDDGRRPSGTTGGSAAIDVERRLVDEIAGVYNISTDDVDRLYSLLDLHHNRTDSTAVGRTWTYENTLFFVFTTISTIGYGNVSPKTIGGRVICIFLTFLGVPIYHIVVGSFSELLARRVVVKLLRKFCIHLSDHSHQVRLHVLLVFIYLFCLLWVIAVWSAVFTWYESWPYLDSIYYVVITISTIGYGDLVAYQPVAAARPSAATPGWTSAHPRAVHVIAGVMFLPLGLVLFASFVGHTMSCLRVVLASGEREVGGGGIDDGDSAKAVGGVDGLTSCDETSLLRRSGECGGRLGSILRCCRRCCK